MNCKMRPNQPQRTSNLIQGSINMFKPFWSVLNCNVQLGMQLQMNFTIHSVPILRTKMGTKSVPETSEHFYTLTRLSARKDFTEFFRRGVFKTCTFTIHWRRRELVQNEISRLVR